LSSEIPLQPLNWCHRLQQREPAQGFASRAAALNGVDLSTLLQEVRISHLGVHQGTEASIREVAALGDLSAAETEALIRYTPVRHPDEQASSIAGEMFATGSVLRTSFRFCPYCVQEDVADFEGPVAARPWLRLEWMIAPIRSCSRHKVCLLEACGVQGRYQALDFASTMAERVLPELDRLSDEADPSPSTAFDEWVIARLDGVRDPCNWLDDAPLQAGILFCEALGVSELHPPKVMVRQFNTRDWATAAAAGFQVCSQGEATVHELLSRLVNAQMNTRGTLGILDTYGYVFRALRRTAHLPEYGKFRDAVRSHAFESLPLEAGTEVLGVALEKRRVHTARSASLETGVHSSTIRTLLARRGAKWAARGSGIRDHRLFFAAEEIDGLLASVRGSLSTPAIVKATGIPKWHLWSMISQGFMPTLSITQHKDPNAKHRIARADVEAVMNSLFDGAVPVECAGGRRLPIHLAIKAARTSVSNVIAFLFRPDPKWKGRLQGGTRYEHILIDADELIAAVRKDRPASGLRWEDVVQLIPGLNGAKISHLAALGVFEVTTGFSPNAQRHVSLLAPESVAAFRAQYVTLGELCRTTGMRPNQVIRRLQLAGIKNAFPPEQVSFHCYVRQAATQAMSA
jgi:hypothetical protein